MSMRMSRAKHDRVALRIDVPDNWTVKPFAAPADAPRRKRAPDAENPDAYKSASCRYRRGRAIPARHAGRRTIRAHGSRTNAAADADKRVSTRLDPWRAASTEDARRRA